MWKRTPILLAILACIWGIGLNLVILINLLIVKSEIFPVLLQLFFLVINVSILFISTLWRNRFLNSLTFVWGISGSLYLALIYWARFSIGIFLLPTATLFLLAALFDIALIQGTIQKLYKRTVAENGKRNPENRIDEVTVDLSTQLTMKEREILSLVATGKSNKEIAVALQLSQNTVRHHVHQVLIKLHCSSRSEAAVYAIKQGFAAHKDG